MNFDGATGALFSIGVGTPKSMRLKLIEYFLEDKRQNQFTLRTQPVLSLYASGRTEGLVVDMGFETTDITPIIDSKIIKEKLRIFPVGGHHATSLFQTSFGLQLSRSSILADILAEGAKGKFCYIDDHSYSQSQTQGADTQDYELPDKRIISISRATMMSPSPLFENSHLPTENMSLASYGGCRAGE